MKKGFTLAEMLITLAVIGVVAALTLPNVLQNYRERAYIATLQKAYNTVSNAVVAMMSQEEIDDLSQSSLRNNRRDFMYKYMKVAKECGSFGECMGGTYAQVGGSPGSGKSPYDMNPPGFGDYFCAVLDSGAGVCISNYNDYTGGFAVMVDSNSSKGPNVNGSDFFQFFINRDGRTGGGTDLKSYAGGTSCDGYSYECFGSIISNGWVKKY